MMEVILAGFCAVLTLVLGLKIARSGEKPEHIDLWSILKASEPELEPVRVTPSNIQYRGDGKKRRGD